MNPNTGKLTMKYARNDGTEYWSGNFMNPNGDKSWPIQAQIDDDGYHVVIRSQDYSTELSRFTIPHFGETRIQHIRTNSGRIIRCTNDVNRIDLAMLAR